MVVMDQFFTDNLAQDAAAHFAMSQQMADELLLQALQPPDPSNEEWAAEETDQELIDYVLNSFQEVQYEADKWHDYIEKCRQIALLHNESPSMYSVKLSKPYNVITYAESIIAKAPIRPKAYAFDETWESIQDASTWEKATLAFWQVNSDAQHRDLKRDFCHDMATDGSAWLMLYIDMSKMPDQPVPSWHLMPVIYEPVDPLTVYPMLSKDPTREFDYIIRASEIDLWNLERMYPGADWGAYNVASEREKRQTMLMTYHYTGYDYDGFVVQTICTDKVLISHDILWHESEFDGFPWVVSPCFSARPYKRDRVGLIEKYQSMLHPLIDSVQTTEHVLSAMFRAMDVYGNMPPVVWTEGGRPVDITGRWGDHVTLRGGEQIGFPQWPGTPPDFKQFIGLMMGDMQEASFSAAAMGFAGSSASGYNVALTTETSRSKLLTPANNFGQAIKESSLIATHMLRTYLPGVVIEMYGRSASDSLEYFGFLPDTTEGLHLEVNVDLELPGDDMRRTAQAAQLKGMGIMSSQRIMEEVLGIDQPDEEKSRLNAEKAESHPVGMLLNMVTSMKERGDPLLPVVMVSLKQALDQFMAEALGGNMAGPRGGPPGIGGPGEAQPPGIGQDVMPDEMSGTPPLGPGGPLGELGPGG